MLCLWRQYILYYVSKLLYYNYFCVCADTAVDSVDSGQSHVRVMHVQHTQGPLDGSLYATVNKKSSQPDTQASSSSSSQHVSQHRLGVFEWQSLGFKSQ